MIRYFREDTKFVFGKRRLCSNWIKTVIFDECPDNSRTIGEISLIFCSDDYLLKINKQFLSHNYYTDVITFDNSEGRAVSGDIFISVDTVKSNAEYYSQNFKDEIDRVIIHGILHLLGYKDNTKEQKHTMKEKEDLCLSKRMSQ